jgi:hypothetical protein
MMPIAYGLLILIFAFKARNGLKLDICLQKQLLTGTVTQMIFQEVMHHLDKFLQTKRGIENLTTIPPLPSI